MRVLVVDDNFLCAWAMAAMLEQAGMEPGIACDGQEALEQILALRHDAVVTDLTLPGLTGLELTTALRQQGYRGRIVVVTGVGTDGLRRELQEAGADDCLLKPVDPDLLLWLLRPTWEVEQDPHPTPLPTG